MTADVSTTGSIARAAAILTALSDAPDGETLTVLVSRTGFTKTTTHRVLASLQAVDFVFQDPLSRRYRLGGRLAEIGWRAEGLDLAAMAERGMKRLAALTEDTVFLSMPEGSASICVAREVGAFPIKTLTLERGDRRPLGVGAGALALYSAMPEARRIATNKANRHWLAEYGADKYRLETLRDDALKRGYALNRGGIVRGMNAIGLPIVTKDGRLVAALAIGAIEDRTTPERIETVLLPALREEAARLSDSLSAFRDTNETGKSVSKGETRA